MKEAKLAIVRSNFWASEAKNTKDPVIALDCLKKQQVAINEGIDSIQNRKLELVQKAKRYRDKIAKADNSVLIQTYTEILSETLAEISKLG